MVQSGKVVSQNILTDWIDPDGDDLFVVGAASSDPRDQVKVRPDGLLSFQDAGSEPGRKTVTVTVSDGRSTTDGKVTVDVRAPGALPPIANADHVVAVAGVDTVIAPLKNDSDPQGGALRLAQVTPDGNSTATMGADQQTFTFNSTAQGAHYVTYLVTNGPASAQQLVRVDVVPGGGDGAPVAVRDTALLPSGGSVLVDVLGNDSDPSGGVLVVQSVTAADGLPVSVSVLDHSVVRITDIRAQGQLSVKYTISNGKSSASGEIAVLVVPAPAKLQAPQAKPDEATVRAGDVVTIPVLENDTRPQRRQAQPGTGAGPAAGCRRRPDVHRGQARCASSPARSRRPCTPFTRSPTPPGNRTPSRSPSASGPATTNATPARNRKTSPPAWWPA